jgi:plastocyanin
MMFVFLLLSLELHILPNPLEGKVGEKIPFTVRVLDEEGKILKSKSTFSVIPLSLGKIEGDFFIANEEGKGVLRCRSKINGKYATGFAYIRISDTERAKISPSFAILQKGEKATFTIAGGKVKEWKCLPVDIGHIENGVFIARNTGKGRVIAVLENGEVKTAFIRVRGNLSDIKIKPQFKRVKPGETIQFEVQGNEKVIWKLQGEKVGEISSNGLFTAKMPGKAVITAQSNGSEARAIVIVSGEVGLRIIPESAELKTGETVRFKVEAEGFGDINIPVRWEVIPKRCGIIRKDGTFIASKIPTKGRVVAILPERLGKGVASADVYISSETMKSLEITPSFKYIDTSGIGQVSQFRVTNLQDIALQWKVIPEDLGTINNNGVFIPKRLGAGVVVAEPRTEINIRPGKAFIIIGEQRAIPDGDLIQLSDTSRNYYASINTPAQQVIEGFKIPLILNTNIANYTVTWRVIPQSAGKIILNREFEANKLPDGVNEASVKIVAIFHRGRRILAITAKDITIIKRQ